MAKAWGREPRKPKRFMRISSSPNRKKERQRMGGDTDLKAVEIRNLQWLVSSPKFSQIVVGDDGYPAAMFCPDPRSFALHKI